MRTFWGWWLAGQRCICWREGGARTDPCGTPFLRRRNLLLLLFPVVRVKLGLLTISMHDHADHVSIRQQSQQLAGEAAVLLWNPRGKDPQTFWGCNCSCFTVDFILRDFLSSWRIRNITCILFYCQSIAQGPAALPNITNGQNFLLW